MLGEEVKFINGTKYKTRCLRAGGGDAKPIILLHGTGGHAEAYIKNISPLSEALPDHPIYSIDFIGHGYSSAPQDIDYEIRDYMNQVEEFIHTINYESAHICGESLGAWIACKIAINKPNLIESAGLNTIGGFGKSVVTYLPEEMRQEQRQDRMDAYTRTIEMLEEDVPRESVRKRLDWLFVDSPDEELVDVRHKIYLQDCVQRVMPTIHQELKRRAEPEGQQYISESELKSIDIPTFILHTTANPGSKIDMIRNVADLIQDSELHLFEESAHWPQYEEWKKFNEKYTRFIDQHSSVH